MRHELLSQWAAKMAALHTAATSAAAPASGASGGRDKRGRNGRDARCPSATDKMSVVPVGH